jgi:putative membrane protein
MQAIKYKIITFLIRYLLIVFAIMVIQHYIKGISNNGFFTAIKVALVMGFLNAFVKPVIKFISIPFTIMTMGLFLLVINVIMVYLTESYVSGFKVNGFIEPLIFSFLVALTSWLAGMIIS